MISFKDFDALSESEITKDILAAEPPADEEYVGQIVRSFLALTEEDGDLGAAFSVASGCVLIRIFDMGRYSFVYPIAICEDADEAEAVEALRAYAVREEIPFRLTDVPSEALGELLCGYRHAQLDAEDAERGSYTVEILNELMLLDGPAELSSGELTLSLLSEADAESYGALCRDAEVCRYWGYDYSGDTEAPTDEYFYSEAIGEYHRCVSLPLAVRLGGLFIGEAVIHAFDFRGGAELGFRLASAWQGKGYGRRTLEAAVALAKKIGLIRLRMRAMAENLRSVKLLSSYADGVADGDAVIYDIELL